MTRKRLKKLLMSYEIQRNDAETYCNVALLSGLSYADWWKENETGFRVNYVFRKIGKNIKKLCFALENVLKRFSSVIAKNIASVEAYLNDTIGC